MNNHLRKKGYPQIENPSMDFESGIRLMQIVNALYDVPIPKHNANPKLRPNKLDNVGRCTAPHTQPTCHHQR